MVEGREVAPTLPGLERRDATRSDEGEWILVLRYSDMEHAAGGRARDTSEIATEFMSTIDMSTMSATFHPIVSD